MPTRRSVGVHGIAGRHYPPGDAGAVIGRHARHSTGRGAESDEIRLRHRTSKDISTCLNCAI
jgi:hypothetical protein